MELRVSLYFARILSKSDATKKDLGFGGARQGPDPNRARGLFTLRTGSGPHPTHSLKILKYNALFIG